MKKSILIIAVMLSLLLSACSLRGDGKEKTSDGQEQDTEAVSYDISLKEISGPRQNLTSLFTTEERFFGIGIMEDGSRCLYVAEKEEIWQGTSAYLNMKKLNLDTVGNRRQLIVFVGMDGLLYTVEEPADESVGCFLCRYGMDGSKQSESDITGVWGADFPIIVAAVADNEGRAYFSRGRENGIGNSVLVLDSEGNLLEDIRADEVSIIRLAAMDDKAYCIMQRDGMDVLCRVNAENGLLQEEIILTEGKGNVKMMTAGTGSLWISDYEGIKEYQPETGELRALLSWVDVGMNGGKVEAILAQDENHMAAVVVLEGKQYFLLMKETGASESETADYDQIIKQQVVIQGENSDTDLRQLVTLFNLQSEEYQVVIRSYDESRLGAELATGNGPDLLSLRSSLDFYVEKGMLEDLTTYLEQSEKLSAEDLNSRVLELYTVDGVLAAIPPTFSIATLEGRASELGTEAGWTTEEFLDYVRAHPGATVYEGVTIGNTQEVLVICTLWAEWDRLIDLEERKAYFDSEYFREIVEFAAEYEEAYPRMEGQIDESPEERLQEGKVLLLNRYIGDVRMYRSLQETFQGDMVFIGFPTETGTPWHGISGYNVYGISATSQNKEGAWAFIEFLVARQTGVSERAHWDAFPTLNSALEVKLNEYQNSPNPPTDEDLENIRQLIDNVSYRVHSGNIVESILLEELKACFAGDRSVDDTVEIIQNRVQLYLDEM